MIASVVFVILGSSRSSKRTSRGAYRTAPRMFSPLSNVYFTNSIVAFVAPGRGSLVRTLLEHPLRDRERREDVGPADVEGKVREHLRSLRLREPVIHGPVQVIRDLRHLTGRNERADRHQAPVARQEPRVQPQVPEQDVARVLHDAGRDGTELLLDICRTL